VIGPALRREVRRQGWLRALRVARLGVKTRLGGHPRWRRILSADWARWEEARTRASGPRVLVATSVGGHLGASAVDNALTIALTLRGARPTVLLCDGAIPACMACEISWYPRLERFVESGPRGDLCRHCFAPAAERVAELGVPLVTFGELLSAEDRAFARALARGTNVAEIGRLEVDGLPVGEHASAGALRFFARADLQGEPHGEEVQRRFLEASILAGRAALRVLDGGGFDCVVAHHGLYVPQGLITAAARRLGIRLVSWNAAYRRQSFIFSHGDSYHRTMLSESPQRWSDLPFGPAREQRIVDYLESRKTGAEDWIWFHRDPLLDGAAIAAQLRLDPGRPRIGLLTSVAWDAQLHYEGRAFPSMIEWLLETIRYFARRPDLELVVRVHPAEVHGFVPSRQRAVDEIRSTFPELPANVVVIPPEARVSTYTLLAGCDAALIHSTKMGVELASMGVPVIVAGEAWIRGKGIAIEPASRDEYFAALDRLPLGGRLSAEQVRRARKYAYHFFFRRMIPLEFTVATGGWPPYRLSLDGLAALAPGGSGGMDVICRGILAGSEFEYDEDAVVESR
jgi:predicted nucleic acid-binding protein